MQRSGIALVGYPGISYVRGGRLGATPGRSSSFVGLVYEMTRVWRAFSGQMRDML
jgi:hypothetical protein